MALSEGVNAPNFTAPCTNASATINFPEDVKGQPCVLYFYPKDFTPVCTIEACQFRDSFSFFEQLNVKILGISLDDLEEHKRFREEHGLKFDLIADPEGELAKRYDAHDPVTGYTLRITYLLDAEGKIRAVYDDLQHSEERVLAMIESLKAELS